MTGEDEFLEAAYEDRNGGAVETGWELEEAYCCGNCGRSEDDCECDQCGECGEFAENCDCEERP